MLMSAWVLTSTQLWPPILSGVNIWWEAACAIEQHKYLLLSCTTSLGCTSENHLFFWIHNFEGHCPWIAENALSGNPDLFVWPWVSISQCKIRPICCYCPSLCNQVLLLSSVYSFFCSTLCCAQVQSEEIYGRNDLFVDLLASSPPRQMHMQLHS